MFAGTLDRRITWQIPYRATNALGNADTVWRRSFDTWACEARTAGAYLIQTGEDTKEQTITLQVRYRPGLKTTDRVLYAGRYWRIHALTEIGRRVGLEVVLRTRTDVNQQEEGPFNVGEAAGLAVVIGVPPAVAEGVGLAAGSSTSFATGLDDSPAVGVASGSSTVSAAAPAVARGAGVAAGAATVSGVAGVDPDALAHRVAVLALGAAYSYEQLFLVSATIQRLKSGDVWAKTCDGSVYVAENLTQALVSWKARRTGIAFNSPVFTANRGIQTNGISNGIDSGHIPDVHATTMTPNSNRAFWFGLSDTTANNYSAGASSPTNRNYRVRPRNGAIARGDNNSTGAADYTLPVATSRGGLTLQRTGGNLTDVEGYKRGVAMTRVADPTALGATLPGVSVFVGGYNLAGVLTTPRPVLAGALFMGGHLSPAEVAAENAAMEFYIAAKGAGFGDGIAAGTSTAVAAAAPRASGAGAASGAGTATAVAYVDPDAQAHHDVVVGLGAAYSVEQLFLVSYTIRALKTAGVWPKTCDGVVQVAENLTQALVSWKTRRVGTAFNSPTFTVNGGIEYNGVTNGVDTGHIPSSHATAMTPNSNRTYWYDLSSLSANSYAAGAAGSTNRNLRVRPRNGASALGDNNSTGAATYTLPVASSLGGLTMQRTGAALTDVDGYKRGVAMTRTTDPTAVGATLPPVSIFIGGYNSGGVLTTPRAVKAGALFFGGHLSPSEAAAEDAIVHAYMTAKGVAV